MNQFGDDDENHPIGELNHMVEVGVRELIVRGKTEITTYKDGCPWMKQISVIHHDKGEGVYRISGSFKSQFKDQIHTYVVRSILYSAALNTYRLTLIDGGNGTAVPLIFAINDKSIENFKLV